MGNISEMPILIKEELRQIDSLYRQAEKLENQLDLEFFSYGINPDVFKGITNEEVQTEAFTDIINGFQDIELNINEIERVFLHYVNKGK